MANYEVKNVADSKETREMPRAKLQSVDVRGAKVAHFVLKPGWKWSTDIKPMVKTEWCEAPHLQYQISGRMHVKLRDGTEFDVGPGDVSSIPAGHDAWVVGDEPVIGIEMTATGVNRELSK
jgi:mannose-6-phosphate isomerase-like protein (cupin superfamily)